ERLPAVTQAVARRELRDRRRLADAGRTDEREDAAAVERILFRHVEPPREPVHDLAPRARMSRIVDLRNERLGEVGIEAESCDAACEERSLRLEHPPVGPSDLRELAAQHAAHRGELVAKRNDRRILAAG